MMYYTDMCVCMCVYACVCALFFTFLLSPNSLFIWLLSFDTIQSSFFSVYILYLHTIYYYSVSPNDFMFATIGNNWPEFKNEDDDTNADGDERTTSTTAEGTIWARINPIRRARNLFFRQRRQQQEWKMKSTHKMVEFFLFCSLFLWCAAVLPVLYGTVISFLFSLCYAICTYSTMLCNIIHKRTGLDYWRYTPTPHLYKPYFRYNDVVKNRINK